MPLGKVQLGLERRGQEVALPDMPQAHLRNPNHLIKQFSVQLAS